MSAFEWDPAKRRTNFAKHGVDLTDFERLDWNTALILVDDRQDYGEPRYNIYGLIDGRLHAATVTPRKASIRVISLRRANRREEQVYEQA